MAEGRMEGPIDAIILAGGFGTRLRARVPGLPKTLAPIGRRPFIELLMDHWLGQGVSRFILCLGYQAGAVRDHFGDSYGGVPVHYSVEDRPLGTGGALLLATAGAQVSTPFLVLNGDTLFTCSLADLFEVRPSDSDLVLAQTRTPTRGLIGGGVYLLESSSCFAATGRKPGEAFSLEDELLPKLRVRAREFHGSFVDIGTPADYDGFVQERVGLSP